MFALLAISILLIRINGQSINPNTEHQDAPFQRYETQVTQVLEQASHGIKCYADYMPKVQHESPTPTEVFSLIECEKAYDANTLHLRDARDTARQSNFTRGQLLHKMLPYVLDTQGGQDEYTKAFQIKLEQLRKAANIAQKEFRAKRDLGIKVTKKPEDQAKDVSKVKEESSEHSKETLVAGTAIAGVSLIGGVVTFGPFVAKAAEVANNVERIEMAANTASAALQQVRSTPFRQLNIGQLAQLRTALSNLRSDLMEANRRLRELVDHYDSILEIEKPEALAMIEQYLEEWTSVNDSFFEMWDAYIQGRHQIINCI